MTDRAPIMAAFIRERRSADRGELLAAIIARWPDATGAEIQDAIHLVAQPDSGRLTRALHGPSSHRGFS